ncbi:MAG: tRNA (N6-isopentenyl adenosine(37)-C2)-methylthiotransferase MiaB [Spirochaetaceae bacterium]|nr:tRNA (N6-isopentenyl adenosine(37)-C2)-methylthiotransferase MiaB [Spirochaetaceae bacterium]
MTYFFETYGCQMNKAESAQVKNLLAGRGWTESPSPETADLAVINTCSVRKTAETRVFGRLGWYESLKAVREGRGGAKTAAFPLAAERGTGRPLTVALMGCMAERLGDSLKKDFPVLDYVVGNFQKGDFAAIAARAEGASPAGELPAGEDLDCFTSHTPGEASAYVPVMRGCDNFCAYCIVPYLRGREVSRPPGDILSELDALSADGVREITLLGQNVNSYRWDGLDFPGLAALTAAHLERTDSPIRWVRFLSSHPRDFSPALAEAIAAAPRLCRHIHLPLQHGSDRILRAMNRGYTLGDYMEKVRLIRECLPDASLSTDILVGFPGETEDDVERTIAALGEARFEGAYTYYYNPREGTAAASMPGQIPEALKKERLSRVIEASLAVARREMAKRVGSGALVLVEGPARDSPSEVRARTAQDGRVVFEAPSGLAGTFVKVQLTALTGNTFRGRVIP